MNTLFNFMYVYFHTRGSLPEIKTFIFPDVVHYLKNLQGQHILSEIFSEIWTLLRIFL